MPVLDLMRKGESCPVYPSYDVQAQHDFVATEVQDRVCLKSQPDRCARPASSHRNAPYHRPKARYQSHEFLCEQCRIKHHSSPNTYHLPGRKTECLAGVAKSNPSSCFPRQRWSSRTGAATCPQCCCQVSSRHGRDNDPHELLQKLLAEQSLIQEAVRRLQFRNFQDSRDESAAVCSSAGHKLFSLVSSVNNLHLNDDDDDSNDQFTFSSQQTPFSVPLSESEDDSVSQHSIDL